MITLTRCSSTPSAEILVKPEGSTRRTRPAERGAAAPALDDHRAGRAGCARRRSRDSRPRSRSWRRRRPRAAARPAAPPPRSRGSAAARRRRWASGAGWPGPPADGRPACTSCARTARRSASADRELGAAAARRPRGASAPPSRRSSRSSRGDQPPWASSRGRAAACARPAARSARGLLADRAWPARAPRPRPATRAVSSARVRGVEQRRRHAAGRSRARCGRRAPDRRARARSQHAPGDRRRDHEAIAHARLAFLVERDLERAAA